MENRKRRGWGQKILAGTAAAAMLCSLQAAAVEDYAYGYGFLEWKGSVFAGDDEKIYAIQDPGLEWNAIDYSPAGGDFFARGSMVYYVDQDDGYQFLKSYDMNRDENEALKYVEDGTSLLGENNGKLYYLEQEFGTEFYEGRVLKSYDLATEEETALAGEIGSGAYWNGTLILTGMSLDASPVPLVMVDVNEQSGLVDENCSRSFYAGDEGFYYWRYNMTDQASWDGAELCSIDGEGRHTIAALEGEYITVSMAGAAQGILYFTIWDGNENAFMGVDLDTGEVFTANRPEPDSIPTLFQDGENVYWYSADSHTIYSWTASGFQKAGTIPTDARLLGISDGYTYFVRDTGDREELMLSSLG